MRKIRDLNMNSFKRMAPDLPKLQNPLIEARNCLPRIGSFGPMPQLGSITNAMDEFCKGAAAFRNDAGTSFVYGGDEGSTGATSAKLYRLAGATWTNSSRGAGYSNSTESWRFAKSGTQVVATNFFDHPQVITLGGTTFADLTTAFKAKHVAKVREFMMFANTNDTTDGHVSDRIRWSAFNNITDYTVSSATQSDFQDAQSDGGACQGLVGGEFAIAFMERSIWRLTYVGPPGVFQVDEVDPGIGTFASGSIVQHGWTYFLSSDGFRRTRGDKSERLGVERVNRTVLADLDNSFIQNVTSSVSVQDGLIYWAYPGANNVNGRPNKLVVYDPDVDEWSFGDEEVQQFLSAGTPATTLEDLDSLYGTLEDVPGSLDDDIWAGGPFQLAVMDSSNRLSLFNGSPRQATFKTGEMLVDDGRKVYMPYIRPLIDGGSVEAKMIYRDLLSATAQESGWIPVNDIGIVPFRESGRYLSTEIRVSGDWEMAVGVTPYGNKTSDR